MQKGGPLMWLILLCSIISVAVFFERLLYFHQISIQVGEFLRGLSNLIQRRNFNEAIQECAGTPGPVARVVLSALRNREAPRSELKEIVQETGQLEVPKLEHKLTILSTIAFVTPVIGLLGTVTGLIEAFVNISKLGGYTTATTVSDGIYSSLLTTAAGLVVAIPSAVAYSYLSARVNTLMHDIERGGIEVVHMIYERVHQTAETEGAAIIDFDSSKRNIPLE
ncbi:MAG TPA: MotA/TolQ/ExbB proton channel family protein [Chthoniobacteraceae bacterium]|nr:MotA/TolQ/ExbB proton channel family protein [Chthoniobacteraceae bacterium]